MIPAIGPAACGDTLALVAAAAQPSANAPFATLFDQATPAPAAPGLARSPAATDGPGEAQAAARADDALALIAQLSPATPPVTATVPAPAAAGSMPVSRPAPAPTPTALPAIAQAAARPNAAAAPSDAEADDDAAEGAIAPADVVPQPIVAQAFPAVPPGAVFGTAGIAPAPPPEPAPTSTTAALPALAPRGVATGVPRPRGRPEADVRDDTADAGDTARATAQPALRAPDTRPVAPAAAGQPGNVVSVPAAGDAAAPPAEILIAHHLDLAHGDAWLDRLAHDIARSAEPDARLRFALAPEHLGRLTVELANGADGTAIRLTTETEQARGIVADAQPRLIAEARAQGLRISDTQVDLGQRSGGQPPAPGGDAGPAGQGGDRAPRPPLIWPEPRRSPERVRPDERPAAQDLYA